MNKKILIVEDDTSIRRALNKKLTNEGFEVFEAVNGEEGLRMALNKKPDLILLDIVMPVMDGLTMAKKLCKGKCDNEDFNIILLTNLSEHSNIAECIEQGVTDYLVKSDWSIDDVVKKVREKLS